MRRWEDRPAVLETAGHSATALLVLIVLLCLAGLTIALGGVAG
jgi:hypothetical protein